MEVFAQLTGSVLVSAVLLGTVGFAAEPLRKPNNQLPVSERARRQNVENSRRERNAGVSALVLQRFKVATDGGFLLLPVAIQGKRYYFALDTGATHGVYDKSFHSFLGDPLRSEKVSTSGGDLIKAIFRSPAGKVGKLALPTDSKALCEDLAKVREVTGQEIYGVLGMDFLRKHVFRIDFDRGEVTFLRSVGPNPGKRVPVTFKGNFPCVMVEVQGFFGRGHFLVDTGCVGAVSGELYTEAFQALAKQGGSTIERQASQETAAGTASQRTGRIKAISLGGYRHEKLLFGESNGNILGLNYWSRYVVTFDFPNGVMYLKKGRRFDEPDVCDMSGLKILRRKGQTLVESVKMGSPAAQAGVKPQDVLLNINDAKTSDMTLCGIRRLLSAEGKKCRVRVQRAEKELKMTIALRDWEKRKE